MRSGKVFLVVPEIIDRVIHKKKRRPINTPGELIRVGICENA